MDGDGAQSLGLRKISGFVKNKKYQNESVHIEHINGVNKMEKNQFLPAFVHTFLCAEEWKKAGVSFEKSGKTQLTHRREYGSIN